MTRRERIEDLGKLSVLLTQLAEDEIFDDLSKHNPEWEIARFEDDDGNTMPTKEELSRISAKLYETRLRLSGIKEKIWDCVSIANGSEYDSEE